MPVAGNIVKRTCFVIAFIDRTIAINITTETFKFLHIGNKVLLFSYMKKILKFP